MSKISRHAEIVAYHEAGHAVVAHMLGAEVRRVAIIEDGGGLTSIKRLGRGERAIVVNLAGPYAQKRHAPRSHWRSVSHTGFKSGRDFDNVTDLIRHARQRQSRRCVLALCRGASRGTGRAALEKD